MVWLLPYHINATANHFVFILLYLDDIQTHVNDMLSTGAVVSGTGVALEGITEVTTVQVMVPQVIMASPVEHRTEEGLKADRVSLML